MEGDFTAAADLATGAVLARAVEPAAGEGRAAGDTTCLNCGASLAGVHCHQCGQKAKVHRTLSAFGHDIAHSVLHFDGKIWRTLPLLIWSPGHLTRRYIHGERAKFVSPLALFLFTVFLTFALFNIMVPHDGSPEINLGGDRGQAQQELAQQQKEAVAAVASLESQLAQAKAAGADTTKIEDDLKAARLAVKVMGAAGSAMGGNREAGLKWNFTDVDFPGAKRLNEAVRHAQENPQLLLYKVQSNAYKFSWALIPISVPFVWSLFFWWRQFKLFDHAVFVTYSLCFMMVALSVAAILISRPNLEPAGGFLMAFGPPIHMYRQLRQAYGISRVGAIVRTMALISFAVVALGLFTILVVALGATG